MNAGFIHMMHPGKRKEFTKAGIIMKALALFCLVIVFAGAVQAAEKKPVFLWSVKGPRGTVHLLGSVHVLKPDAYPLDSRIERAYRRSRRVVFEADMEEARSREVQQALISQGMYQDKTSLKDHISKKTYGLLEQRLNSAGIPASRFAGCKPWLCAVSLSGMELKRLGYDPGSGIDAHFSAKAKKDGKETIFFESARYQIGLLSKTLGDMQEDLLKQALKELEVIAGQSAVMMNAWKEGDTAKMESLVNISLDEYPEIRNALFTRRNSLWASHIEELMKKDGDTIIIVGAGHLVGEQGVPALLRQKGYKPVQQ